MTKTWWKESVIYQIYPRSFQDSNGDGVGDLQGIIQRLDYLKLLGVDILWLSPIFKSPNDDNGYDVSDYKDIMDEFGTLEDFDRLLKGVHERGMRLILDLVPNHSSDEHFWFQEARKSKHNPYRDYYYWADTPKTNWQSFFSGSTWEYDEIAKAYYLHLFSKKQPDLNWENPKLREEIHNIMCFWFDRGIDGFRIDVIPFISKRLDWPDSNPDNFDQAVLEIYANGPRLHEFLHEMYEEVWSQYDIVTVGEGIGVKPENSLDYIEESRQELNMLYHFDHVTINYGPGGKYDPIEWKLSTFKRIFLDWDEAIKDKGWINIVLDNHDFPRMVSRYGDDGEYRIPSAKLLATLLLTLRGTPCLYQGSEIGMINVAFDSLEEYDDVEVVNLVREWEKDGKDTAPLLKAVQQQGRDNARTPMQWSNAPHAGFTQGTPWLKLNPSYTKINVKEALDDPSSIFYYYKELLAYRKANPTLIYGDFELLAPDSEQLFAYRRWDANEEFLIFLNFSATPLSIQEWVERTSFLLIKSNYPEPREELEPWGSRIYHRRIA